MSSRPRLQSLIFEVTQRCNHACLHCYNVWQGSPDGGKNSYPRGELDTARTLDLLSRALEQTVCRHVTFTGGEPLLRPDLPVLLEYLRERNVETTVISNGRLLDEKTVVRLLDCGVGLFELPLLSDRREVHDELSATPGAWDAVLAALANIRLHHGQAVAAFVATQKNVADLAGTARLAFAFGVRGMMLNRFNPGGRGRQPLDELLPTLEQVREMLVDADAAGRQYGLPISCSIPLQPCLVDLPQYPHLNFGFCAAGTARAYYTLDPLGNLRPCNHSDLILGNLFEHTFPELVGSPENRAFGCALPEFCRACSRAQECQGGCKAAAQVCFGSPERPDPFLAANLERAVRQ
jgi:radical SAM protein with 4Fe4S-binding SPASM domain